MNEIVKQEAPVFGLSEQVQYAKAVAGAGLLPKQYQNHPSDIIVAMGLGQSMGLSPMESLYRINVINGKPTASAELIAAQVRKAGHKLRIRKDEARQSVTATIIRADDPEYEFIATRDKAWAERMGLSKKENYKKQPMTMLTWRAITAVAREACPEALYGVAYTPDEMHDMYPVPVEAEKVEQVEHKDDDLQPIRARIKDFASKLGYDMSRAMSAILTYAGVQSMDDLTPSQVADVCGYMDDVINTEVME